jgi:hypothetical protein
MPLTVEVPCGDLLGDLDGPTHEVKIRGDWSVDVRHDLELERIASGLGGSPSCLHLIDRVIPALRAAVHLLTRRGLPVLHRDGWSRQWHVPDCRVCGYLWLLAGPLELRAAVAHVRSVGHLVDAYDCDERLLRPLLEAASAAYGGCEHPPRGRAGRFVQEPGGLQALWDLGVHPGWVVAGREHFWPTDQPLPADFFVGLAYLRPNERYLAAVIAALPDPNLATWALWSQNSEDSLRPTGRADLISAGVDPGELMLAMDMGNSLDKVHALSHRSDRTLRRSVACLAAWARIGCRPDIDDLAWGIGRVLNDDRLIPRADALDALLASLPRDGRPTRTAAGLVLAVSADVSRARTLLVNGIRTPTEAFEFLEDNGLMGR